MRANKAEAISGMTMRQKVTAVAVLAVVVIVVWQVIGLFSSGDALDATVDTAVDTKKVNAMPGAKPSQNTPQSVALPQAKPMTEMEMQLLKLQQETQAKYVAAMNELQLLKVERDIAQTSKDISSANLDKVTSDKKIVDMLAPSAPPATSASYAKNLENQGGVTPTGDGAAVAQQSVSYTVISVTQLQSRWAAVMGYQGNLYSVHTGDVLPPDGSIVISIQRDGVTLKKGDDKRKISLVPII